MSEEQLSALLAKLKGAADLDAAVAIAKAAGFVVSKADWLRYQAKQTLDLSDEDLECTAGGKGNDTQPPNCTPTDNSTMGCSGCSPW